MQHISVLLILIIFASTLFIGCVESDIDDDGYADEIDDFPNDAKYHSDRDGDGYADEIDDFPNDAKYHSDQDGDGYADEIDDFPNDAKYHSDRDGDGYADEIDDFPDDARYHSDYDGDGYADEIDDFPSNSLYHATCSVCDGSGFIYSDYDQNVEFTKDAYCNNVGIFNPDYYQHVTVTNIDSNRGTFKVHAWATDNGVKMWEEYQSFFIDSGDSHEFVFHYDADEEMDVFYSSVTPPTYIKTIKNICSNCEGAGKI